jgi:hypothetical protein
MATSAERRTRALLSTDEAYCEGYPLARSILLNMARNGYRWLLETTALRRLTRSMACDQKKMSSIGANSQEQSNVVYATFGWHSWLPQGQRGRSVR